MRRRLDTSSNYFSMLIDFRVNENRVNQGMPVYYYFFFFLKKDYLKYAGSNFKLNFLA